MARDGPDGGDSAASAPQRRKWRPAAPLPPLPPGTVRLLAGGNPQIAKADGDAPVAAWVAAMPGWKSALGRRIDDLVARTCPGVQRAVRWNAPFWGLAGKGWFLSLKCTSGYVKVVFPNGAALQPMPPVASKVPQVRYLHLREADTLDEMQLADWLRQAARAGGKHLF